MYNRAHCVQTLIQTLEKQTFKDFHVTFVDDGSSDNTREVLENLPQDLSFSYNIIYKQNGGAGSARNAGMRASDADYIVFIDSDDEILPEYLQYLYEAITATNADFGYCDFKMIFAGSDETLPRAGRLVYTQLTAAECMRVHYTNWLSNACLIINGDYQRQNNIYYDEDCAYTEDNNFLTDLIVDAQKVVSVKNALYIYYLNQGSLSRSPSVDKFISGVQSFQRMEAKLKGDDRDAAKVFKQMAGARYYLATFRKAAVQMDLHSFMRLCSLVHFSDYKHQLPSLSLVKRICGYLLLVSPKLFYRAMHTLFKD